MPKKAKNYNNEDLALMGITYSQNKNKIKEIESANKKLREPLESAVTESGQILDSGSQVLSLVHADKEVVIKRTLRAGKVLLPEAVDVLMEAGFKECVETLTVVREDVVESLYEAGKIDEDVIKKIYQPKDVYAFSVDVKERRYVDEEIG